MKDLRIIGSLILIIGGVLFAIKRYLIATLFEDCVGIKEALDCYYDNRFIVNLEWTVYFLVAFGFALLIIGILREKPEEWKPE